MKKLFLLTIILISFGLIFGCTENGTDDTTIQIGEESTETDDLDQEDIKLCENDNCFLEALDNCEVTSYNQFADNEFLGNKVTSEIEFKITTDCKVEVKANNLTLGPSDELLEMFESGVEIIGNGSFEEIYQNSNSQIESKLINKSGVCDLSEFDDDLSMLLENFGIFILMGEEQDFCQGDLFEAEFEMDLTQ